tara:strand:- start:35340 stop:36563 length:1224 start_codon:yes stop_codon:yes gene_type:complete
MKCRHCEVTLNQVFLDLGSAPPSNAYLTKDWLDKAEIKYPLKVLVCSNCWLVQTEDYAKASELFSPDYAYFSSISKGWLDHAEAYCDMVTERLLLDSSSFVIEIASNDGYLLKNFVARSVPCLGIEPTDSTARAAENIGIPVMRKFFGEDLARKLAKTGKTADLVVGNNVYAHVPDVNDFTRGIYAILKEDGVVTLEFPHLLRLIEFSQFDTVYHEHFSYFSLMTVKHIFEKSGLRIFDVEEISTHGGSLRVFGCRAESGYNEQPSVAAVLNEELNRGLNSIDAYKGIQSAADRISGELKAFLLEQRKKQKLVAGYGAAAKGNTLLNYAGVNAELIPFISDAAESKQKKFMPGSHIPIVSPQAIIDNKPDFVIIFPWNIAAEVQNKLAYIRKWGGKFVTAVPKLKIS